VQPWQRAALGAAAFLALHYTLLRAASGRLGDVLGALVVEVSAALGIAAYFAIAPKAEEATTAKGIAFAAGSGLAVSVVSILLFYALRRGGPVASTGTIVLGGGVLIAAIFAPVLFGETLTWRRVLGVALGLAALAILSTEKADAP
jgi:drug/metabolite transporter (DMT)-like permease